MKMKATGMRIAVASHAAAGLAFQNLIQQIRPNSAINRMIPEGSVKKVANKHQSPNYIKTPMVGTMVANHRSSYTNDGCQRRLPTIVRGVLMGEITSSESPNTIIYCF